MAQFVLSVVGSDRPGLTRALAAAVLAAGGNWLESHLSRLGGLYVGSVLVEIPAEGAPALRAAVTAVDAAGLEVRLAPAGAAAEAEVEVGEALALSLVGQDQPGIVNQVTGVLSALGANIESLGTRLSAGAHSGAPLFHMDARLRLPPGLEAGAVQAGLEAISGEIMVDITLAPAG